MKANFNFPNKDNYQQAITTISTFCEGIEFTAKEYPTLRRRVISIELGDNYKDTIAEVRMALEFAGLIDERIDARGNYSTSLEY